MTISIVIPCYRSELTIRSVVDEVREVFTAHPEYSYQFVLVNDGSPDGTFSVIRRLCSEDPNIVGLDLSRNFGQANARVAALPYVRGDIAVYMDDDGQHPADGIIPLVEKVQDGYDVVFGKLVKKKVSFFKRVTSEWNSKVSEFLEIKPKGVRTSPFMAWSRFAIDQVLQYHSPFASVIAYLNRVTSRFAAIEVEQRARMAGTSGYNLKRLLNLALQEYTSFSLVPLRLSAVLGMITAGGGFLAGMVLVIRKLLQPSILIGYTSQMVVLLIIGGILMMMLGLLGEYIGRIYMTLSNLPQFRVREVLGVQGEEGKVDVCTIK